MKRWGRVAVRLMCGILAVLLLVGAFAVGGGTIAVRASFPQTSGSVSVPGLSAPVTVSRDAGGVPQLYASTATDLFRAQGYVHAQDRFWEMDFRRHVTAGRLSEMFGASQVDTDAAVRTMGWRRVAEREFGLLSARTKIYLQAYAAGVNAYLRTHQGLAASLEYGVLKITAPDYRIEPWTPVDSVAWLKAMAWDLRSNLIAELDRAQLLTAGLSRDRIEQLWPAYPFAEHAPIVGGGGVRNGTFRSATVQPAVAFSGVSKAFRALDLLGPGTSADIGSNSWVIAGSRTTTGKPILANDPHLGPGMPSIWYQMGLHCRTVSAGCPFSVLGYSFSGVPGIVIGHNERIAWGFTNLGPDVADLYLEKLNGTRYQVGDEWRPLQTRKETIRIAGGSSRVVTVRSTGHGPLMSDVDPGVRRASKTTAVSLRWTALDAGRTMDAVFSMALAQNWPQFREAARLFAVPAQNLVYADVDGNIGYQAPGDIPVRGLGDGRWPAPGWDPRYDWKSRIPYDALPSVLNPQEGFVVTANQAVVGPGYPYLLTTDWEYGYRSQRIRDLITSRAKVSVADVQRMQMDTRNGNAVDVVPALLRIRLTGFAARAQDLLRGWDFQQPAGSAAGAFFNATWRHLLADTFYDDIPAYDRESVVGNERWFAVVKALLADPRSPWWDVRGTKRVESRDDILARAMTEAATELADSQGADPKGWQWGRMHQLTLRNASLGNSGIAPIEALFNRGPYAVGGGGGLVDATGWIAAKGYAVASVPSMRMIVDTADLDRSRWIDLTGVSGHAYADHYGDQTPLWQRGELRPMPFSAGAVRASAVDTLELTP
ncbi:penicillin acylase family protein [Fodinicola acaciae]|uniref:penicillin acylase family protein n=1 Tax=Fodinicola acaciae TaxID=2681555 RepID=UPI0013D028D0|nr:penicillin acylase family protein [Fodinicola acaciae]